MKYTESVSLSSHAESTAVRHESDATRDPPVARPEPRENDVRYPTGTRFCGPHTLTVDSSDLDT